MLRFLFQPDSKEEEAAASAYNTPYNQGRPSGSGNSDLPPNYFVCIIQIHIGQCLTLIFFVTFRTCHPAMMMHRKKITNNDCILYSPIK